MLSDDDVDGDRPDEQPQLVLDEFSGVSEAEARAFLADHTIQEKQRGGEKTNKRDVPLSSPAGQYLYIKWLIEIPILRFRDG